MQETAWKIFRKYVITIALKYVSGPFAWIATKLLPRLLDKFIKPHYLTVKRKVVKLIRIENAKKKTKKLKDAKTATDYLNELNKSGE